MRDNGWRDPSLPRTQTNLAPDVQKPRTMIAEAWLRRNCAFSLVEVEKIKKMTFPKFNYFNNFVGEMWSVKLLC